MTDAFEEVERDDLSTDEVADSRMDGASTRELIAQVDAVVDVEEEMDGIVELDSEKGDGGAITITYDVELSRGALHEKYTSSYNTASALRTVLINQHGSVKAFADSIRVEVPGEIDEMTSADYFLRFYSDSDLAFMKHMADISGVPPQVLLTFAMIETINNPNLTSRVGAAGLFQHMDFTARSAGNEVVGYGKGELVEEEPGIIVRDGVRVRIARYGDYQDVAHPDRFYMYEDQRFNRYYHYPATSNINRAQLKRLAGTAGDWLDMAIKYNGGPYFHPGKSTAQLRGNQFNDPIAYITDGPNLEDGSQGRENVDQSRGYGLKFAMALYGASQIDWGKYDTYESEPEIIPINEPISLWDLMKHGYTLNDLYFDGANDHLSFRLPIAGTSDGINIPNLSTKQAPHSIDYYLRQYFIPNFDIFLPDKASDLYNKNSDGSYTIDVSQITKADDASRSAYNTGYKLEKKSVLGFEEAQPYFTRKNRFEKADSETQVQPSFPMDPTFDDLRRAGIPMIAIISANPKIFGDYSVLTEKDSTPEARENHLSTLPDTVQEYLKTTYLRRGTILRLSTQDPKRLERMRKAVREATDTNETEELITVKRDTPEDILRAQRRLYMYDRDLMRFFSSQMFKPETNGEWNDRFTPEHEDRRVFVRTNNNEDQKEHLGDFQKHYDDLGAPKIFVDLIKETKKEIGMGENWRANTDLFEKLKDKPDLLRQWIDEFFWKEAEVIVSDTKYLKVEDISFLLTTLRLYGKCKELDGFQYTESDKLHYLAMRNALLTIIPWERRRETWIEQYQASNRAKQFIGLFGRLKITPKEHKEIMELLESREFLHWQETFLEEAKNEMMQDDFVVTVGEKLTTDVFPYNYIKVGGPEPYTPRGQLDLKSASYVQFPLIVDGETIAYAVFDSASKRLSYTVYYYDMSNSEMSIRVSGQNLSSMTAEALEQPLYAYVANSLIYGANRDLSPSLPGNMIRFGNYNFYTTEKYRGWKLIGIAPGHVTQINGDGQKEYVANLKIEVKDDGFIQLITYDFSEGIKVKIKSSFSSIEEVKTGIASGGFGER